MQCHNQNVKNKVLKYVLESQKDGKFSEIIKNIPMMHFAVITKIKTPPMRNVFFFEREK